MIIEIKNLPQGRKVKHINVDITFEEDGVSVDTKTTNQIEMPIVESPQKEPTKREQKEVPPEMTDMEF